MLTTRAAVRMAGALLSLIVATGCGNSTTLSGNVTYEGRPVEQGAISLLPVDGKGPSVGGPIADGKFRVENLTPGEKVVQIVGVKKINFAASSAEMERASKAAAARGDATGILERADIIPDDAEGNNAVIELKPGTQTKDFSLKRPVAR